MLTLRRQYDVARRYPSARGVHSGPFTSLPLMTVHYSPRLSESFTVKPLPSLSAPHTLWLASRSQWFASEGYPGDTAAPQGVELLHLKLTRCPCADAVFLGAFTRRPWVEINTQPHQKNRETRIIFRCCIADSWQCSAADCPKCVQRNGGVGLMR